MGNWGSELVKRCVQGTQPGGGLARFERGPPGLEHMISSPTLCWRARTWDRTASVLPLLFPCCVLNSPSVSLLGCELGESSGLLRRLNQIMFMNGLSGRGTKSLLNERAAIKHKCEMSGWGNSRWRIANTSPETLFSLLEGEAQKIKSTKDKAVCSKHGNTHCLEEQKRKHMAVRSGLQTERCLWEPYRYLLARQTFTRSRGQILPVVCVYMDLWAENDFYIIKALKKKQRKRKRQRLYVSPKNLKRVISSPLQKNSAKPWTRGSFSQNDGALGTPSQGRPLTLWCRHSVL